MSFVGKNKTKAESARIEAVKDMRLCMACEVRREQGLDTCDYQFGGVDYQHRKSGNIRMGHMFGYGLDPWHHRHVPLGGMNAKQMREKYGPSIMDGGKTFANAYEDEQSLMQRQNQLLGEGDE